MPLEIRNEVIDNLVGPFRRSVPLEVTFPREQTHCSVTAYTAIANDRFDAVFKKHPAVELRGCPLSRQFAPVNLRHRLQAPMQDNAHSALLDA